jgi:hypothetical protein
MGLGTRHAITACLKDLITKYIDKRMLLWSFALCVAVDDMKEAAAGGRGKMLGTARMIL